MSLFKWPSGDFEATGYVKGASGIFGTDPGGGATHRVGGSSRLHGSGLQTGTSLFRFEGTGAAGAVAGSAGVGLEVYGQWLNGGVNKTRLLAFDRTAVALAPMYLEASVVEVPSSMKFTTNQDGQISLGSYATVGVSKRQNLFGSMVAYNLRGNPGDDAYCIVSSAMDRYAAVDVTYDEIAFYANTGTFTTGQSITPTRRMRIGADGTVTIGSSPGGSGLLLVGGGAVFGGQIVGQAGLNLVSGAVQFSGVQVLNSRKTGWGTPTGTLNRGVLTNSSTQTEFNQALMAVINDLIVWHGAFGA